MPRATRVVRKSIFPRTESQLGFRYSALCRAKPKTKTNNGPKRSTYNLSDIDDHDPTKSISRLFGSSGKTDPLCICVVLDNTMHLVSPKLPTVLHHQTAVDLAYDLWFFDVGLSYGCSCPNSQ